MLYPLLQIQADEFERRANARGLNVKITDCVRTQAEQAECVKRGTSTVDWLHSHHSWGLAFDICKNSKNEPYPDPNTTNGLTWWKECIKIGKDIGLTPGGEWKKPDYPHFQLDCFGDATDLIAAYGDPYTFMGGSDYKIVTPALAIDRHSKVKKILWLQTMLCVKGYTVKIDGIYGPATAAAVRKFWKAETGKDCGGYFFSVNAIKRICNI
jgi:hypothetical protein